MNKYVGITDIQCDNDECANYSNCIIVHAAKKFKPQLEKKILSSGDIEIYCIEYEKESK